VIDADFDKAMGRAAKSGAQDAQTALHKGVQQPAATSREASQKSTQTLEESEDNAGDCENLRNHTKGMSGERGIRTLGRRNTPYAGLANRCNRPLCHLSGLSRT